MVSLDNSRNTKGGFTFDRATPINDDFIETLPNTSDRAPLTSISESDFKQIRITFAILTQILSVCILQASVFLIPYFCGTNDEKCSPFVGFDLTLFLHAFYWFLKLIFDRFYHYQHMLHRRQGYLKFYRSTRTLRYLPLVIISAGNSMLIYLINLLQKYCTSDDNNEKKDKKCFSTSLNQMEILQIYVSFECLLLFIVLIIYLVKTIKFNRLKESPDVSVELDRPLFDMSFKAKSVGAKDSSYLKNILENQADMIRYLQERNKKLTMKLYALTNNSNTQNIN